MVKFSLPLAVTHNGVGHGWGKEQKFIWSLHTQKWEKEAHSNGSLAIYCSW
jgi:hypothetical protein